MSRNEKKQKNRNSILAILAEKNNALSSVVITDLLKQEGFDISERSVRLYLNNLDEDNLTKSLGKKGHIITDKGIKEVKAFRLMDRVGYMSAKIDSMTYKMTFDLALRRGLVVVNTSIVGREILLSRLSNILRVFDKGYAMGKLVSVLQPGDYIGNIQIPAGMLGLCTVCSITLNGVLLKHGIPTRSLFSGLLELEDGEPVRFAELINYNGTSIDPLELFIRNRMTDYLGAIHSGNGHIGAGFREIPAESYNLAISLAEKLENIGLGAFMKIGQPSRQVLNIPVMEGCCGAIVTGGLNPVAILEETGIEIQHFAISGLLEFNNLFHYSELKNRI